MTHARQTKQTPFHGFVGMATRFQTYAVHSFPRVVRKEERQPRAERHGKIIGRGKRSQPLTGRQLMFRGQSHNVAANTPGPHGRTIGCRGYDSDSAGFHL
jgi:hypothetical protein